MDDIILSRRKILQSAGLLMASSALPMRVSFAAAPTDQRFIYVILRGAMDGLAAIPPYGDRGYAASRGPIALPRNAYTPLDNFYGAHNSLGNFITMFKNGEAAALHAVSTPYRERSHFDAQNVLETGGTQAHGLHDGWLNRALSLYGGGGLAVGQTIPLALQGPNSVGTWAPSADGLPEDTVMIALEKLYRKDPLLHDALAQAVGVHGIADSGGSGMFGKQQGPKGLQNKQAMEATVTAVGKILSDPKGPRIATIELGGWDTHAQQGLEKGALANNLAALDAGFGAIKPALGPHWANTVILAATEFGRTVAGNGTGGTDHGTASCAFLLGGAVAGGKVIAQWPGLDKTQQFEGRDLRPTTDLRQAAKAILAGHLHMPMAEIDAHVFPGSTTARALDGIIKT